MNDVELADQFAAAILADHAREHGVADVGGPLSRLAEVFRRLRELGLNWTAILAMAEKIVAILIGGGDWMAILRTILALFGKTP